MWRDLLGGMAGNRIGRSEPDDRKRADPLPPRPAYGSGTARLSAGRKSSRAAHVGPARRDCRPRSCPRHCSGWSAPSAPAFVTAWCSTTNSKFRRMFSPTARPERRLAGSSTSFRGACASIARGCGTCRRRPAPSAEDWRALAAVRSAQVTAITENVLVHFEQAKAGTQDILLAAQSALNEHSLAVFKAERTLAAQPTVQERRLQEESVGRNPDPRARQLRHSGFQRSVHARGARHPSRPLHDDTGPDRVCHWPGPSCAAVGAR